MLLRIPLADRLLEAAGALDAHLDRMGMILGALHASGAPNRRSAPPSPSRRDTAQTETRDAVVALFEPDRERLRFPVEVLADAYLRLLFGRVTGPGRAAPAGNPDRRQLVDLLLNGAFQKTE